MKCQISHSPSRVLLCFFSFFSSLSGIKKKKYWGATFTCGTGDGDWQLAFDSEACFFNERISPPQTHPPTTTGRKRKKMRKRRLIMRINRKGNKGSNVREMRDKKLRVRVIGNHTPLTSQDF